MTFYKLSKKQDLAKSMLEVGLINLFGFSKNQKTLKQYLEVKQN